MYRFNCKLDIRVAYMHIDSFVFKMQPTMLLLRFRIFSQYNTLTSL